ncbi:GPI ethanolamine phosphate transferase 1 isoform X1 [Leptidea sinapis]|uniref:GPI ethanolamine phosphate transferase 1 isoform X1 n=1 Tax=Leptidea sinapis TaxID=189913 RepID=UPI0021400732|nr:GPI ethanolamine phosphate transferase 1 isoform X1 [Leptidea sinapis]
MFLIGVFIHVVFLISIFDIYFKSPIVKNIKPHTPNHDALADRLVLFVVDGLRAESFLNHSTMSYLRSVGNSNGRWGISHTRVPTESRPGHVAIIAGFYEDPSAVVKGWKENPVDFDSLFNQSSYTWCWGAYDIIDIFSKDQSINSHIFHSKFDPYDQTFSSDKNTTLLDRWVFDKVQSLFENAKVDENLNKKLLDKKIIFFLHLLGTDTSGHTHKPKTKNFITTLQHVDEGIKNIEQLIRDFYNNDGKTTFLMTSDHGMTDWGSHGTGDDHETKTPYVLWGAGVKQVESDEKHFDVETNSMILEHRYDLNQADLTPLMASFLSIPVPVNSIGQLKPDLLDTSKENKAKAVYSNSRQLLAQYNRKRLEIEANAIKAFYKPYGPLNSRKVEELIQFTERLLEKEDYDSLMDFSYEIMNLSLSGLEYYHNYYQKPLLLTTTLSFLGWITYLLKVLLDQTMYAQVNVSNRKNKTRTHLNKTPGNIILCILLGIGIIFTYLIYEQNLPTQYYIYFLMPLLLWYYALTPIELWIETLSMLRRKKRIMLLIVEVLCYVIGCIALALSFSYRWMLSIPLLGMSVWPMLSSSKRLLPKYVCVAWPAGCVALSIFSFMPVVGKDVFIELVYAAGFIWLLVKIYYVWFIMSGNYENTVNIREIIVSVLQMILLTLSLQIIFVQSKRFENGSPISQLLQTACWCFTVILSVLPLLYSTNITNRLHGIFSSIVNFYLLLSVSHEGLFMVTLLLNILCWMYIEFKLLGLGNRKITDCDFDLDETVKSKHITPFERSISSHDFRRAFFFMLYVILAYFGTGNIASLNSFEVRWVLCYTTSFQPFVITALILLKTLSPLLAVGCCFRAIQKLTKAPMGYLNIMVLIYSNIMGLQLLYYVKNTGSWLEIGTSISLYVIVQVLTLFIVIINQIAKILTEFDAFHLSCRLFSNKKKEV